MSLLLGSFDASQGRWHYQPGRAEGPRLSWLRLSRPSIAILNVCLMEHGSAPGPRAVLNVDGRLAFCS